MNERSLLLQNLRSLDFALWETGMYLNGYASPEALAYYKETSEKRKALAAEFETKYGPLRMENAACGGEWAWTKGPLPWESEAN